MIASSLKNVLKDRTCNMNSEVTQTSHLKSEEDANNSKKQNGMAQCQQSASYLNGTQHILASKRSGDTISHEENHGHQKPSQHPGLDAADEVNEGTDPSTVPKKLRQQKEMTFQDIYREEYDDNDDEDEDSDWEPSQDGTKKWFCTNCTMVNFDDVLQCDICGELKDSEILTRGFFASNVAHAANHFQLKSEVRDIYKGSCSLKSATDTQTAVGFDERMLLHSEMEMKLQPHPERPDRLRAITASLSVAGIFPGRCFPICAREITKEELELVHSVDHIEAVEMSSSTLSSYFTPDTYANEHSACAARLAAGLCADLSSAIMDGRAKNGFALVRPPGHHAGVKQVMGFCLHNNAAVAALAAQRANAKKVLIVDWDVHHGNGTQEIFDANKTVLYISLHRHEGGRFYPGTGAANEVGTMGAEGYCVNIPWKCGGVGDNDYIFAFQHIVLPIASEFAPDLTIISAGFDAARGDPLGCCDVTPAGFAWMTQLLTALSNGRLLVILEGGYNLRSISSSATAVIKVLLGEFLEGEPGGVVPTKAGLQTVMEVLQIQMKFWPNLESILTKLQSEWPSFSFENRKLDQPNIRGRSRKAVKVEKWASKTATQKQGDLGSLFPIIPRKEGKKVQREMSTNPGRIGGRKSTRMSKPKLGQQPVVITPKSIEELTRKLMPDQAAAVGCRTSAAGWPEDVRVRESVVNLSRDGEGGDVDLMMRNRRRSCDQAPLTVGGLSRKRKTPAANPNVETSFPEGAVQLFAPCFFDQNGERILQDQSATNSPGVAFGLLKGCRLPGDVSDIRKMSLTDLENSIALNLYRTVLFEFEICERDKKAEAEREKLNLLVATLDADKGVLVFEQEKHDSIVKGLKSQLVEAEKRASEAESKVRQLEEDLKREKESTEEQFKVWEMWIEDNEKYVDDVGEMCNDHAAKCPDFAPILVKFVKDHPEEPEEEDRVAD